MSSTNSHAPAEPGLPRVLRPAGLPEHDLADGEFYEELEFVGLDLSGQRAASVEVTGCRFHRSDLSGAILDRALFIDCVLEQSNLANLRAERSALRRVRLSGSRTTGLQWVDGALRDVTITDSRLDLASFRFTKFTDVVFEGCDLRKADFLNADLRGARFLDCDLTGARFAHATMAGTRLSRCTLVDVEGVSSFTGATVHSNDLIALTYAFADALGITVESESPDFGAGG